MHVSIKNNDNSNHLGGYVLIHIKRILSFPPQCFFAKNEKGAIPISNKEHIY